MQSLCPDIAAVKLKQTGCVIFGLLTDKAAVSFAGTAAFFIAHICALAVRAG